MVSMIIFSDPQSTNNIPFILISLHVQTATTTLGNSFPLPLCEKWFTGYEMSRFKVSNSTDYKGMNRNCRYDW